MRRIKGGNVGFKMFDVGCFRKNANNLNLELSRANDEHPPQCDKVKFILKIYIG